MQISFISSGLLEEDVGAKRSQLKFHNMFAKSEIRYWDTQFF